MWLAISLLVLLIAAIAIWQRIRSPLPAAPPLDIPNDEPRMLAAVAQARSGLPRFLALARQNLDRARVRLPLATSSGNTEHLWAEVLRIDGDAIDIRLITPPTTHSGEFERVRHVALADLDDWQIETESGAYIGGFTMRAMFVIALEQWGSLPPELEQLRARYAQHEAV